MLYFMAPSAYTDTELVNHFPSLPSFAMTARHCTAVAALLAASIVTATAFTADPPQPAKPSTYAPAKDLIEQVSFFLGRIETDLEDKDAYEKEVQERVEKDANTVAVLAAVLGMHDEQHDKRAGASALAVAAKQIASSAKDHAKASEALKNAQAAMEVTSGGGKIGLEGVADLAQLMKQVPIVNNSVRSGVTGSRFARLKEKTAQSASTLAAIAEVSAYDESYTSDDDEKALWMKICFEMRDASAAVATATRAGDQETAKKELDRLVKTCDDCHHKFRD